MSRLIDSLVSEILFCGLLTTSFHQYVIIETREIPSKHRKITGHNLRSGVSSSLLISTSPVSVMLGMAVFLLLTRGLS